jgi:hypothetical protein
MTFDARVLIVGRDQMLMQTRGLILGTYFHVETANRVSEAVTQFAKHSFDLVVLCHSLSDDEYSQMNSILELVEPQPKVLTLNFPEKSAERNGTDYSLSSLDGPYALLKKAAEILGFEIKGKARESAESRAARLSQGQEPASV